MQVQESIKDPTQEHTGGWGSAWVAGFLAVLISYAGPLVIFIQAAHAGNISNDALTSWIWAISMGAGVSGLLLSWWLKLPIITAWSAPGTALLISLFPDISMPEVVGAYIVSALVVMVIGFTGAFEKVVKHIPSGIAAGMMAGILFQFGLQAFQASMQMPAVVFAMLLAYMLGKRLWPRYCVVLVALTGFAVAYAVGETNLQALSLEVARPVWVTPVFNMGVFLSFTVPLIVVSLTGQYLPGMAVLQLAGYRVPSKSVVGGTGVASLVIAGFGGITIVLAAITAALCTGKDAHPDPRKRYIAGIANGCFYLLGGSFAGTIVQIFAAFPSALIAALAGLALIGAIISNLRIIVGESNYIEPSAIAFLATASGMTIFGLGAAFWGVVLGMLAYWLMGQPKPAVTK